MERLHPSKHVIFRISKLSPKSHVGKSGQRRTQSQTFLQNRGTGLQRQGKFRFIVWIVCKVFNRSQLHEPSKLQFYMYTSFWRVFWMLIVRDPSISLKWRRKSSLDVQRQCFRVGGWKKTHALWSIFFLSSYLSWSDNWQLWSSTNSKSCNTKRENRVLKKIRYVHNHDN